MTETRVADDRAARPSPRTTAAAPSARSWSSLGRRVYRTATVTCGAETPRTLSSVAFMIDGPTWVDVQSLLQDGQTHVRVTRYHPAGNQRLADGQQVRLPRPGAYDRCRRPVDRGGRARDAGRARARRHPGGNRRRRWPLSALNRRSLTTLADAGVAERVIDLMVGLTYPEHFVIKSGGGSSGAMFAGGGVDPFFAPIVGPASLYGCYSPYAWASGYYFDYCGAMSPMLIGFGPSYYNGIYGPYNYPWVPTTEPPIAGGGGGAPGPGAVARPRRQRPRLHAGHAGRVRRRSTEAVAGAASPPARADRATAARAASRRAATPAAAAVTADAWPCRARQAD